MIRLQTRWTPLKVLRFVPSVSFWIRAFRFNRFASLEYFFLFGRYCFLSFWQRVRRLGNSKPLKEIWNSILKERKRGRFRYNFPQRKKKKNREKIALRNLNYLFYQSCEISFPQKYEEICFCSLISKDFLVSFSLCFLVFTLITVVCFFLILTLKLPEKLNFQNK